MKKIGLLSLFILLLIVSACNRDDVDIVEVDDNVDNPDVIDGFTPEIVNVNANLKGLVLDQNGNPVSGASISMNDETTSTDSDGYFLFQDKTMNSKGQIVRVSKDGYFSGSRRFFPEELGQSFVQVELVEENFNYNFESNTGGVINAGDGITLNFSANSIKDASNNAYSGEVRVAVKSIDPNSTDDVDQMPGNLQGVNLQNEEVVISLFGISVIELQSPSGEALNIIDGATATISINISSSMLSVAPAETSLWSYNETYGLWEEEGTATLDGDKYTATVSHFSYWAAGNPLGNPSTLINRTFRLEGRTSTESGGVNNRFPLADHLVLFQKQDGSISFGFTNGEGLTTIPTTSSDESIDVKVFDFNCSVLIYDNTIDLTVFTNPDVQIRLAAYSPFSGVDFSNNNTTGIKGQLVDGSGNPVSNGLIKLEFAGNTLYHYTDSNGYYERGFNVCAGGTVTFTGIDLDAGNELTLDISARHKVVMGQITVDATPEDFEYVRIKDSFGTGSGAEQFYTDITGLDDDPGIFPKEIFARAVDVDGNTIAQIQVGMSSTSTTTSFNDLSLIYHSQTEHGWNFMTMFDGGNVDLSAYGSNFGEEISGTFSGDGSVSFRTTQGSFRIFNPNP